MLDTILKIIAAPIVTLLIASGYMAPVTNNPAVGAALPAATAAFETSLQSPISSSATSMTLAANSVRGGGSLSGYNCFTIDEGSAQAETVCGTVSGTSVTSLQRGISQSTGTSTVSTLQFSHRRGASVKITDFPLIQILKAQNNGEDTFPNPIRYDAAVTTSVVSQNSQNLATVGYANSLSFGAIPAASESASGFSELSTQTEAASSTSLGSTGARLVLPGSLATSTYNSATAGLRVVVTKNNGKIDDGFISTSTILTGQDFTFGSSTIVGSTYALDVGKNLMVITTTGTSTVTIPSGIRKLEVEIVGPGEGGEGGTTEGAGGGAGGYGRKMIDVSATTSIQVFVGSATAFGTLSRTSFGTNGFYMTANGGLGGSGGSVTGADFAVEGGNGKGVSTSIANEGGWGGNSFFGTGGYGGSDGGGGTCNNGNNGRGYGSGGGGAGDGTGSCSGGGGTNGVIIIRY